VIGCVAFQINEAGTISDDVLHVLHVWDVKTRVEDLACDPIDHREPDLAIFLRRAADGQLVSGRPRGANAGTINCSSGGQGGLDQCRHHERHQRREDDPHTRNIAPH
jgi:hypothetical protein